MKTLFVLIMTLLLVSSGSLQASEVKTVKDFTLKDYNGKPYTLSEYRDADAIVLMFIATKCPISNAYNERMEKIYNTFKERNVVFLGINSNKAEDADEVKKHAAANKLTFPILKDPNNIIADQMNASVTPEIFVLNNKLEILYHGRIDDSQRPENIKSKDLKLALQQILDGKAVTNPKTKAFGCTIKRII